MVASRATIECFLYMDLSPSSSHEVKSSCYSVWMLANIAKKLGTIAKTACLCSRARVDHDRIRDVGPDRAASEWLLRCGALVRYRGQERWQKDYNHLPAGPLDKYKIQAIDATESCIMSIGFDHMGKSSWEMRVVCNDLWLQLTPFYSHTGVLVLFSPIQLVSSCVWYLFLSYIEVTSTLLSFLSTLSRGLST